MKLLVGIVTFRRPDGLARLLDQLARIELPTSCARPVEVSIVDNDDQPSAQWCRSSHPDQLRVNYLHLGEKNISSARNELLRQANHHDLLIMLDDDEWPSPGWLTALVDAALRFDADCVIGPVFGELPATAPAWSRGYFNVQLGKDGELLQEGITGNALLRMATINHLGLQFATALGNSGGEDQLFFRELHRKGGTIRYSANAIATETVPIERTKIRYLLRRSLRIGNTLGLLDTRLLPTRWSALVRLVKAAKWGIFGVAEVLVGIPLLPFRIHRGRCVHGLTSASRSVGMIIGIAGWRLEFYDSRLTFRRVRNNK